MSDAGYDLADLTWEEARALIGRTLTEHHYEINGNGKDGIKQEVQTLKEDLVEIKAYGKATAFWAKAAAGLLVFIATAFGIWVGYLETHHRISQDLRPAVSSNAPQNAGSTAAVHY